MWFSVTIDKANKNWNAANSLNLRNDGWDVDYFF